MTEDLEHILEKINNLAHEKTIPLDVVGGTVALVEIIVRLANVSMVRTSDPWSCTIQLHTPLANLVTCVVSRLWIAADPLGVLFSIWISGSTISPSRVPAAYRTPAEAADVILRLVTEDIDK